MLSCLFFVAILTSLGNNVIGQLCDCFDCFWTLTFKKLKKKRIYFGILCLGTYNDNEKFLFNIIISYRN